MNTVMHRHAFIEHRPKSFDPHADTDYHVVVVDYQVVELCNTQKEAADLASSMGYIVHVARERHRQDKTEPSHWHAYP